MQGAIFDMDGTLIDSMPVWCNLGYNYLSSHGIQVEDPSALRETLKPLGMWQVAELFRSRYGFRASHEEIVREIDTRLERHYFEEIPLLRDAAFFLEQLKQAGVKMCVATATDRYLAEGALKRLGILPYFSFLLTCPEIGADKDNPRIFEEALARLGTPKAETYVFEDALYAIRTAKKAGFPVVAIADDFSPLEQQEAKRLADRYIRNYRECEECLV